MASPLMNPTLTETEEFLTIKTHFPSQNLSIEKSKTKTTLVDMCDVRVCVCGCVCECVCRFVCACVCVHARMCVCRILVEADIPGVEKKNACTL